MKNRDVSRSALLVTLLGASVGACSLIDQFPELAADPEVRDVAGPTHDGGDFATTIRCMPGVAEPCYSGPAETRGAGACVGGQHVCNPDGMSYGPCSGEKLPQFESCATMQDENCDGVGCVGEVRRALSLGGIERQEGTAVATFSDVVVFAGFGSGRMRLGADTKEELGDPSIPDAFLAKLDASRVPLWSLRFSDSAPKGVAFTPSHGDVVLVGSAQGDVDFGGGALPSGDHEHQDLFIARFSAAGAHMSSARFGDGPADQVGSAVAVAENGDALITGSIAGTLDCKNGTVLTSAGGADVFLARVNPDSKIVWCARFGDEGEQRGTAIAAVPGGDIVVAGSFKGGIDFGDGYHANSNATPLFLARFSPEGKVRWSEVFTTQGYASATSMVVSSRGDITLAGFFSGGLKFPTQMKLQTNGGDENAFVATLGPNGKVRWSRAFGDMEDQEAWGVSVDADGNTLLTGGFSGTIDFGGKGPLVAPSGQDIFVTKLDGKGQTIWAKGFGSSGDQVGAAVAVDELGAAWLTGSFAGSIELGDSSIQSAGGADAFLLKLTP